MFLDAIDFLTLENISDLNNSSDFDNFFDSFIKNSTLIEGCFVGKYKIKSLSESFRKDLLFGSKLSDIISLFDEVFVSQSINDTYIVFGLSASLRSVDNFYKKAKERYLI